jgi:hypothetical protein
MTSRDPFARITGLLLRVWEAGRVFQTPGPGDHKTSLVSPVMKSFRRKDVERFVLANHDLLGNPCGMKTFRLVCAAEQVAATCVRRYWAAA